LSRAWSASRGTALRASLVWAFVALVLGLISQLFAMGEPLADGRPSSGHVAYLCTLAAIASLISVLNARSPGGGAWAILMAVLVLVFLIPWLEGAGLGRGPNALTRLRLDDPWTIFYGLLVVAGVTNYLPTHYGPSAAVLGAGFALEFFGLTQRELVPPSRGLIWSLVPWVFVVAALWIDLLPHRTSRSPLETLWFWFRNHWGVVWGLRVQERFNRSAEAQGWPMRLSWHEVVFQGEEPPEESLESAVITLKSLLRRFAEPARMDQAMSSAPGAEKVAGKK
jgi:hypothetical protein